MRITLRKFLIFLLVFTSLVPNIGIKVTTLGFNWTIYRTAILVSILLYLYIHKNSVKLIKHHAYRRWIILMAAWVLYGVVLMAMSSYRNPHNGFVELLSIFNGLTCIYILSSVLRTLSDLDQIVSIASCVFIILVALGCIECVTSYHLPMSYFHDSSVVHLAGRRVATGIFYSENDFSSFLTCFAPILLYKKRSVILNGVILTGVLYINYINDANICIIAMIVGMAYYFIFVKKYGKNGRLVIHGVFIIIGIAVAVYVWSNLRSLSGKSHLLYVIYTQQLNNSMAQGSMHARLTIYADSLKASLNTAFLGIGPASFSNYFLLHPSKSGLVNPHNLYLEMLVEYGLAITTVFVAELVKTIYTLTKRAITCRKKEVRIKYIAGCEMLVLYSIVCMSPSSFIGYSWQWIVITIGIALCGILEKKLIDACRNQDVLTMYSETMPCNDVDRTM